MGRSLDFLNSLTFPRGEGGLVQFTVFLAEPGKERTLWTIFAKKNKGVAGGT